jgi:hypothetical protein
MNEQKLHYKDREIVLEECEEGVSLCHGCVLEDEDHCVRAISPQQGKNVCCPKYTGKFYIFKFKEEL